MRAEFAVVVPSYNEGALLLRTMRSVAQSLTGQHKVRLVVVDDCSTDNTSRDAPVLAQELERTYELEAQVVRPPSRLGVAAGKNYGCVAAGTPPACIFLDAHSVVGPGALERLAAPLLANPDVVVTGPTTVSLPAPETSEVLSGRLDQFQAEDLAAEKVSDNIHKNRWPYGRGQRIKDPSMLPEWAPLRPGRDLQRTQIVIGSCMGIRTDSWGGLPYEGFDKGFAFPWGAEDLEVSLRAWRLGKTVVTVPESYVATLYRPNDCPYGIAPVTTVYNALRLAALYLSEDVIERVVHHYWNDPDLAWALTQLWLRSNVAARRRQLDEMGPHELTNMVPVFREFGGLNVIAGRDRRLIIEEEK